MGLKLAKIAEATQGSTVWIEPRWDWNFLYSQGWSQRNGSLNRTKVGLKQSSRLCILRLSQRLNRTKVGLKPACAPQWRSWTLTFESNQGGIETLIADRFAVLKSPVWIEPRWDWNPHAVPIIIVAEQVWIEPRWDWNPIFALRKDKWNIVWIEPRWDWNFGKSMTQKNIYKCLNRTKVGLKLAKIAEATQGSTRFESNQGGIETRRLAARFG